MRFSFSYAALAALAAQVAYSESIADLVAQIPSCAVTCLATAATNANCGISDYNCQCGSAMDAIATSAVACLATACDKHATHLVARLSSEICAEVSCATTVSPPAISATGTVAASTLPASIPASIPSVPGMTTSTAPAATTPPPPPASTNSAGLRLKAGVAVVGAVILAALAL